MDAAHAQTLPDDAISMQDWRFFRQLVVQSAAGITPDRLLSALEDHLGVTAIALVRPDERPPDMQRVVVVALQAGDTRLGDLYAALSHQADSVTVAARLAFFAPVIALCAAVVS